MNKQALETDVIDIDVPSSADFVVMLFKPLLQAVSFPHVNQRALVVKLVYSLTFWERAEVFFIQRPYLELRKCRNQLARQRGNDVDLEMVVRGQLLKSINSTPHGCKARFLAGVP